MQILGKTFNEDVEIIKKNTLFYYLKKQERNNLKTKKISIAYISMYDKLYKPFIRGFIDNEIIIKKGWKEFIKEL